MKKTLCNEKTKQVSVHVEASIDKGKLLISGQDFGDLCGKLFGDTDYEYYYSFNESNTKKILQSLKPGAEIDELLELLCDKFSGIDGCKILRKYCKKEKINYKFFNYF